MTLPSVSIIIPCRNEERHIAACLDALLATEYPRDRLEILVVDGMSSDGTRDIVRHYALDHPAITLIDNAARTAPAALNAGIRRSTGRLIVRVDAHATLPPEYLPVVVAGLLETGADNAGGLLVTLPANGTATARAIAIALSHRLGVGNSHFRVGTTRRRWVDTVQFGCYRRELFDRIGLFDEELVRNQDDEFNLRLIARGGRILLLPETKCYYYARGSFPQVGRMCYQYGYFKPLVARKVGRIMTLRQVIPALFLLALLGTGLLGLAWPAAGGLFAAIFGSYLTLILAGAMLAGRAHGVRCAALLTLVFPLLHVSYGLGYLHGAVDQLVHRHRPRGDAGLVPLSR